MSGAQAFREGTISRPGYLAWTAEDLLHAADFITRTLGYGKAELTYGGDGTPELTFRFTREEITYFCKAVDAVYRLCWAFDTQHQKMPRRQNRLDVGGTVEHRLGDWLVNGESLSHYLQNKQRVHVVIEECE